jgi:dimethylargininase
MPLAITRGVSSAIARCELSHIDRIPIDVGRARAQHAAYERALESLGFQLIRIEASDDHPDCVFVEDTAIVVPELAIMARPGAASRRGETAAVAAVLERYRPLAFIEAPGTIDGGDVLRVGHSVFVGRSSRTNDTAVAQLGTLLVPHGYEIILVAIAGALHLKSAVTQVAEGTLLINRAWVDAGPFARFTLIDVEATEPFAANALLAGATAIYANAFPRTKARLESRGIRVLGVDASELAKAEGGVTCGAILLE